MKVLHIGPRLAAQSPGRMESYGLNLAQALRRRGVETGCAASLPGQGSMTWQQTRHKDLDFYLLDVPASFQFSELYDNQAVATALLDLAQDHAYDLLHVHHLMVFTGRVILEAARRGLPVLLTLHDFWLLCYSSLKLQPDCRICRRPLAGDRKWCLACLAVNFGFKQATLSSRMAAQLRYYHQERTTLNLQALRAANLVTAVSQYVAEEFSPHLPVPPVLMSPGVEPVRLEANFAKKPAGSPLNLVMLGGLSQFKGALTAVRVCADFPEAALHIYGPPGEDPDYQQAVKTALQSVPERIFYHGLLNPDNREAVLASADLILVPSWNETYGFEAREALAAGKPVLAAEAGGLKEDLGEGVLFFPPGDEDSLAALLRRLISEPNLLPGLRAGLKPPRFISEDARIHQELYTKILADAMTGRSS